MNLEIWEKLQKTDPKYTKNAKIKGGMNITAINATYQAKRMTEVFGICGIGWGIKNPVYSIVDLSDDFHDKTLFFTADLFYVDETVEGTIPISAEIELWSYSTKWKTWSKNNDVYKKVKTDAMTKGFSLLGLSSDVFMGMYDDHKYVNEVKQEFKEDKKPEENKTGPETTALTKEQREKAIDIIKKQEFTTQDAILNKYGVKGLIHLTDDNLKDIAHKKPEWFTKESK